MTRTCINQEGVALPVGMILLMILTLLGVAAMNASRMEIAMAGGMQAYQYAYQSAEAGISRAMKEQTPAINMNTGEIAFTLPVESNDFSNGAYSLIWITQGPPPAAGSTLGAVTAHYFEATSSIKLASSGQTERHVQGFYVMAPGN